MTAHIDYLILEPLVFLLPKILKLFGFPMNGLYLSQRETTWAILI